MRRLHVVLSDQAAEQLDELRDFWWQSTGGLPSPDMMIQRAIADCHDRLLGPRAGKPGRQASRPAPGGRARRIKAS